MADRIITNESFEVELDEVFHYVHSEYKPFWHSGPVGRGLEIDKQKKEITLTGFNSGLPTFEEALNKLIDEGEILPKQDYLLEVKIKITKLKRK